MTILHPFMLQFRSQRNHQACQPCFDPEQAVCSDIDRYPSTEEIVRFALDSELDFYIQIS